MKILVVEDNYDKVKAIHDIFSEADKPFIKSCLSSSEAKFLLVREYYDVVVLDIQIPDIEGGEISPSGGIDLLSYIESASDIRRPGYILGLTGFRSNFDNVKKEFEVFGWPLFDLKSDYESWSQILLRRQVALCNSQYNLYADVALITALEHTELAAVLATDNQWEKKHVEGVSYYHTTLKTKAGKLIKLVAAASERMGMAAASIQATKIGMLFNPKLMIMCGICAGVKGKINLGDIVIADHSWDWGSGKIIEEDGKEKFLPEPHQIPLARNLRNIIKSYAVSYPHSDAIYQNWKSTRGDKRPDVHLAPMACGSQVIANASIIDAILDDNRKMLALEMESYGFLLACDSLNITAFVAKSVCDFADKQKSDDVHDYAAYTSVAFAFNFIDDHFTELFTS